MKKIVLFMLLLISTLTLSETIEKISYSNGALNITLKGRDKVTPKAKYSSIRTTLDLEFSNTKLGTNILKSLKLNDQYVESINLKEELNSSIINFKLKPNIDYKILSRDNEIKVDFVRQDGGTSYFNDIPIKVINKQAENNKTEIISNIEKSSNELISINSNQNFGRDFRKSKKYTIVVDAGHGGHDSGALGNGYREKDITLAVSKKLAQNLSRDYNVIMTRDADYFVELSERANIGNRANADLFVSIHLNSAQVSANGAEVFIYDRSGSEYASKIAKFENSLGGEIVEIPTIDNLTSTHYKTNKEASLEIAVDVLNNLVQDFGVRNRGVFGANFAVLRRSKSPAILVELGFMTNYGDVSKFVTEADQERAAKNIADGIRNSLK